MSKYVIPTDEQITAYLAERCEKTVEANAALLEYPCISCGQDEGIDGYCDDVECPNYKDGLIAGYLEDHGLETVYDVKQ